MKDHPHEYPGPETPDIFPPDRPTPFEGVPIKAPPPHRRRLFRHNKISQILRPGETWYDAKAREDRALLKRITDQTDPIADEALQILDVLPPNERQIFLRGLLGKMVVQTLGANSLLDSEHVNHLGGEYGQVVSGFGSGYVSGVQVCAGAEVLKETVITESLPKFDQPQLQV